MANNDEEISLKKCGPMGFKEFNRVIDTVKAQKASIKESPTKNDVLLRKDEYMHRTCVQSNKTIVTLK